MPVVSDTLWKHPGIPGMIVVSSHATVDPDGRLCMSEGPAAEAARRIPGIDLQCGEQVRSRAVEGIYGFLPVRPSRAEDKVVGFGLFQTRLEQNEPLDLDLIRHSMNGLRRYVDEHQNLKVRMSFPGLEVGRGTVEQVAPLLLPLPPTVTVCHNGEIETSIPSNFVGFKAVYVQVERMILEGRAHGAVEFLMQNGFDIQSAMEQVAAVERVMRERRDREAEHVRQWRRTHIGR